MKILITGGTGFLGARLTKKLIKEGHDVTIYSRNGSEETKKSGAKEIIGDACDKETIDNALKKIDIVYHLAANLDESDPDMEKTNIRSTGNMIEACKKNKIKRLIFTSSIGVLGYTKEPAKEDMPCNPTTRYEKSKMECERLIKGSGIPYTIARITIIYGQNRFWRQIFRAAKKGYPVIGRGDNYWHLVYVDDVVDALILMLKDEAKNKIYHIADNDPHTYLDTYRIICKTLGLPEPKKHVPVLLVKTVAFIHETKCKLTGKKPNVTKMRSSIDRLIRNRIVSIRKAKKELGYSPKYDLKTGLKKTYEDMKSHKDTS
ncbi:MAG: NAD(P)-dependent oxidoreductase [archaeon]